MCHDVGALLTAGPLFYRDRAIGATQTGESGKEGGPCMKIQDTKRAQEKKNQTKQAGEMLIQREGEQENEGAGEKMERDTDGWGESK